MQRRRTNPGLDSDSDPGVLAIVGEVNQRADFRSRAARCSWRGDEIRVRHSPYRKPEPRSGLGAPHVIAVATIGTIPMNIDSTVLEFAVPRAIYPVIVGP